MNEFSYMKKKIEEKLEQLEKLERKVSRALKKAPEGTLVLSISNGLTQYYHKTKSEQKKGTYLNKNIKDLSMLWHKKITMNVC